MPVVVDVSLPSLPQPPIVTVVSLPYHLVLPVALFFAWGALTALCEIHDRLEEQADLMSEDESRTDPNNGAQKAVPIGFSRRTARRDRRYPA